MGLYSSWDQIIQILIFSKEKKWIGPPRAGLVVFDGSMLAKLVS